MAMRQGGSLVSTVRQLSHRVFLNMLQKHGLTDLHPAQGKILFALMNAPGGLTIGEIGGKTLLKKSTLTAMLGRMEANGYLTRTADPQDGRATKVCLTDKFRGQMNRFEQVSQEMTAVYYAGFEDKEIDLFESMLERILGNLVEYETIHVDDGREEWNP